MKTQQSMIFGNTYIEDLIDGYTTISVEGRETLDISYESETVGNRDGSIYKRKKYDSRTLTVSFVIHGSTREELLDKCTQLNGILNKSKEVKVRFNDELDVFYIGTRIGSANFGTSMFVSSDDGVVSGTFQIFCADPFKYSVNETTIYGNVDNNGNVDFDFYYDGTAKAYPRYETDFFSLTPRIDVDSYNDTSITGRENENLDGKGECTFVAFYNDREKILQFGNPEANNSSSGSKTPLNQNLIQQQFQTINSWGTTAQQGWTINNGVTLSSEYHQTGSLGLGYTDYETDSESISGTIMAKTQASDTTAPRPYYTVKYSISSADDSRTSDTVKIKVTVTAKMPSSGTLAKKCKLVGTLNIAGQDYTITIKKTNVEWKKSQTYTASKTITISGISANTQKLENVHFKVESSGVTGTPGKLSNKKVNDIFITQHADPDPTSWYLHSSDYGTLENDKFNGPTMIRTLSSPADNFSFTWNTLFCIGKGVNATNEMGAFQALILTSDNTIIAGVTLSKTKANTYFDSAWHYTNENGELITLKKEQTKTAEYDQAAFSIGNQAQRGCEISKIDNVITFNIPAIGNYNGNTQFVTGDYAAAKIQFGFFEYSSYPSMEFVGITDVIFTKLNDTSSTHVDVRNPFSAAGVLIADTATADITLDGVHRPELGALGNDWEDMCLYPGPNTIGANFGLLGSKSTLYLRRCFNSEPFDEDKTYYNSTGTKVTITEEQYDANPTNYYIKETAAPKFMIHYREVFI